MSDKNRKELTENELNQVAGGFSPLQPGDSDVNQMGSDTPIDNTNTDLKDKPLASGAEGQVGEGPIRRSIQG